MNAAVTLTLMSPMFGAYGVLPVARKLDADARRDSTFNFLPELAKLIAAQRIDLSKKCNFSEQVRTKIFTLLEVLRFQSVACSIGQNRFQTIIFATVDIWPLVYHQVFIRASVNCFGKQIVPPRRLYLERPNPRYIVWTTKRTPRAVQTRLTVSKRGCASGRSAL